jgi:hypothetical protein
MAANTANTLPIFNNSGRMFPVIVSAANTSSDGSGSLVTLVTAPTDGCLVSGIRITNAQASAAASSSMVCRVFLSDVAGINPRLINEVALTGATRSVTAIGATVTITFSPSIVMKSGQLMQVCQSVYAGIQDQNSFLPYAGDY